jgi:crotonobetainyl-CoA:carnitine CoA-transferase CaiB-like acyl-CoA transferase
MGYQTILVKRRDAVELVTMNRPEVRNAQNSVLILELDEAMRAADDDPDVNVIVLAGAGRDFSSGHDLKAYVGEAAADEWHEKRSIVEVDDPELGPIKQQAPVPRLGRTPLNVASGAPRLGEHTDEVLGGLLGMTSDEISNLRAEGVV